MTEPVIERLELHGVPASYASKAKGVLTRAVAEYYSTQPIYSLEKTKAKHLAARLVLKDVVVQDGKLVITLGI